MKNYQTKIEIQTSIMSDRVKFQWELNRSDLFWSSLEQRCKLDKCVLEKKLSKVILNILFIQFQNNNRDNRCWLTKKQIAFVCVCSTGTVQYSKRKLRNLGFMNQTVNSGGKYKHARRWNLHQMQLTRNWTFNQLILDLKSSGFKTIHRLLDWLFNKMVPITEKPIMATPSSVDSLVRIDWPEDEDS